MKNTGPVHIAELMAVLVKDIERQREEAMRIYKMYMPDVRLWLGQHIKRMRSLYGERIDRTGALCWRHPLRMCKNLIQSMKDERATEFLPDHLNHLLLTILYHDVIDTMPNGDSELVRALQTESAQIAGRVFTAVNTLSRRRGENLKKYIKRLRACKDYLAIGVKCLDITDQAQRLSLIRNEDMRERLAQKYNSFVSLFVDVKLMSERGGTAST